MKAVEKKPTRTPRIEILTEWCKGCGICVAFCPKDCLALRHFKAVVVDPETCIRCMMCELRCPDFCITVE